MAWPMPRVAPVITAIFLSVFASVFLSALVVILAHHSHGWRAPASRSLYTCAVRCAIAPGIASAMREAEVGARPYGVSALWNAATAWMIAPSAVVNST